MKQALVVTILITVAAASARAGDVTRFFPDGTEYVLAVDVQALFRTEAFKSELRGKSPVQYVKDLAAALPKLKQEMEKKGGANDRFNFWDGLLQTTTRYTLAGSRPFDILSTGDTVTILEGTYDRSELVDKIKAFNKAAGRKFRMEIRDEITIIYIVPDFDMMFIVDERMLVCYNEGHSFMEGVSAFDFGKPTPEVQARRAEERRRKAEERGRKNEEYRVEWVLSRISGKKKPMLKEDMAAALETAKFAADRPVRLVAYAPKESMRPLLLIQGDLSISGQNSEWEIRIVLPTAKDAESYELEVLKLVRQVANGAKELLGDTPIVRCLKEAKVDRKEAIVTVNIGVPVGDLFAALNRFVNIIANR